MKAPSQHIPEDPRLGRAWNEGWNGQGLENYDGSGPFPFRYNDPEMQAAVEQGWRDGKAVDAHNSAIWASTPKGRFGNQ